jgi:hypothetical protein
MKKKTQVYDRSYSYNSHNFRRSSYFAFIFLEGKSQSDNLLYREYIADAKLLQKSEMRKDIVIELSYKGFG